MEPDPQKQQHFLKSERILDDEVAVAKLTKKDRVVEIGAGDGRLTKLIAKKAGSVTSYETDEKFKDELENLELENVIFTFHNALDDSWKGHNKIVSNIPYSLSEPVIMKAIKDDVKEITLIVGEKFANLLKDQETKIGVIADLYFSTDFIQKIGKAEFEPPPRVDSYLVHMKRKKPTEAELVIQSIIEKESKTKNAIIMVLQKYGKTKNQARKIIDDMRLNAETLEKSTKTISGKFIERLKEEFRKRL